MLAGSGAGGAASATPVADLLEDFTKIDVAAFADGSDDNIPWADISIGKESLRNFRAYHAYAILLFYCANPKERHVRVWNELCEAWLEYFGSPISHASLESVPRFGKLAYTDEEEKWCKESRRYLVGLLEEDEAEQLGIPVIDRTRADGKRGKRTASKGAAKNTALARKPAKAAGVEVQRQPIGKRCIAHIHKIHVY